MRLDEVMPGQAEGIPVEVRSLAYDSREVGPGTLFFCVPGFNRDGHEFAAQAEARGAGALVVERPLGLGLPEVLVQSVRAAMGPAADRFYGHPSGAMEVVGVTGTNGKTTTAFLVRHLLEAGGVRCGMLGTVKSVIAGQEQAAVRTTAEAIDLQADLRRMADGGDRACAMEVSSHALALDRARGVSFAAAIFTNLTQDHLDFHPSMEDYFLAKRRLFEPPRPGVSVVNVDDPYGRRLEQEIPQTIGFSLEGRAAAYRAHDLRGGPEGSRFTVATPAGTREVSLPLAGRFNIANTLGALAAVHALGGDLDGLVEALAEAPHVPGRLQSVREGQPFTVLVDYAHTPDSLENVLQALRDLQESNHDPRVEGERSRLICVFGAGGDRDPGKRPLMGAAAAGIADLSIVTSDNPRSEDPREIVRQVLEGMRDAPDGHEVEEVVDRREAIGRALARAAPGDVVLIAGKGHEQGQELAGGVKVPFDDVQVARETLRGRAPREVPAR